MSIRYLDIDSTYRDRNKWPLPSEFIMPVSINGRRPPCQAVDPVCLSAPILRWKPYILETNSIYSNKITLIKDKSTFSSGTDPELDLKINGFNDEFTFFVHTPKKSSNVISLHKKDNYYAGLNAIVTDNTDQTYKGVTRITSYKYKYTLKNVNDGYDYDYAIITVSDPVKTLTTSSTVYQTNEFNTLNGPCIILEITDNSNFSNICHILLHVPSSENIENAYPNYYIQSQLDRTCRKITNYLPVPHVVEINFLSNNQLCIEQDYTCDFTETDTYLIRKELPIKEIFEINKIIDNTKIVLTSNKSFDSGFVRHLDTGQMRKIVRNCKNIIDNMDGFEIETPFEITFINFPNYNYDKLVEILPISYDNFNPLSYDGTWVQTDNCYEVRIESLVLPNAILTVYNGGNIAFYPYVYVELSSESSNSGNINLLYSNNPYSSRCTFRIPIYDTTDPSTRPFVLLSSDSQVMKMKPNSDIRIAVRMENGELFKTVIEETYSPFPPNPYCQIRANISIRKL
jgi:hypothetical protein